ncbi:MAG: hypothetical protein ACRDOK_01750 [Streptosporangiaceae bacterium]
MQGNPNARNTDPETSHEAAERINRQHVKTPPDEVIYVQYATPSSAIHALEGVAVAVKTHDGVEAVGIVEQHIPPDGTTTQVHIRDILTDELILGTDIRNFAEIVVP